MKDTQAIFSAMLESKNNKSAKVVRKVESIKRLKKESDEAPEEFTGSLVKAQSEDAVMDDVLDNIQVVTDPEKTVDELEVRADEIQDAIEGSPEGMEAFSDEYVGDKVYACPICGESFFAGEDYSEGDACPICKAEPTDGFLLQGVVAPCEGCDIESEEAETNIAEEEPSEDETVNDREGEDEIEAEESYKKESKNLNPDIRAYKAKILDLMTKRTPAGKAEYEKMLQNANPVDFNKLNDADVDPESIKAAFPGTGKIEVVDNNDKKYEISVMEKKESVSRNTVSRKIECDAPESEIEVTIDLDDNKIEIEKEPAELETELDEKSFEGALNQFADDNYNGTIDEISVSGASYDPKTDELCMDCVAECKNGDRVPLQFRMKESRVRGNKAILVAKECKNVFKVESKTPAFKFQVVNNNGTICCESLKYSFTTTHSKAGKVKVEGYCKSRKRNVR